MESLEEQVRIALNRSELQVRMSFVVNHPEYKKLMTGLNYYAIRKVRLNPILSKDDAQSYLSEYFKQVFELFHLEVYPISFLPENLEPCTKLNPINSDMTLGQVVEDMKEALQLLDKMGKITESDASRARAYSTLIELMRIGKESRARLVKIAQEKGVEYAVSKESVNSVMRQIIPTAEENKTYSTGLRDYVKFTQNLESDKAAGKSASPTLDMLGNIKLRIQDAGRTIVQDYFELCILKIYS